MYFFTCHSTLKVSQCPTRSLCPRTPGATGQVTIISLLPMPTFVPYMSPLSHPTHRHHAPPPLHPTHLHHHTPHTSTIVPNTLTIMSVRPSPLCTELEVTLDHPYTPGGLWLLLGTHHIPHSHVIHHPAPAQCGHGAWTVFTPPSILRTSLLVI